MARLILLLFVIASMSFISQAGTFEKRSLPKDAPFAMEEVEDEETGRYQRLNNKPVCFSAKGNSFGRFHVPKGGLAAIKLVHLYGYVSCDIGRASHWSYWGCGKNTWNGINTQINAVITTSSNQIILPPSQFIGYRPLKWYNIPGYNSLSPELVLSFFSPPRSVHQNQELRLWYGEDLLNLSEGDNGGKACVDVYALFV